MGGSEDRRETLGCTLGIAFGLVLVFVSVSGLLYTSFLAGGTELDGQEYAASVFRQGEAPYGLVPREAIRLGSGETVYSFGLPAPEAEQPARARRTEPEEILLIEYPERETARETFLTSGSPFDGGEIEGREDDSEASPGELIIEWQEDPTFAWHTTLDAGAVSWRRWRADYRIERSFREGGTWRDLGRVDLCQEGRYLILFGVWPPGVEVDVDGVRDLLTVMRML